MSCYLVQGACGCIVSTALSHYWPACSFSQAVWFLTAVWVSRALSVSYILDVSDFWSSLKARGPSHGCSVGNRGEKKEEEKRQNVTHPTLQMTRACVQLQSRYGTDLINQTSLNRAAARGNNLICIGATMPFASDAKMVLGRPDLHCACSSTFPIQSKQCCQVRPKKLEVAGGKLLHTVSVMILNALNCHIITHPSAIEMARFPPNPRSKLVTHCKPFAATCFWER